MAPRKIDLGEALAAAGALLLVVSLFLEWFGGASAWEAFESLDLVLLLGAFAVLAAVAGAFEWLGARLLAPLGGLLLLVVIVQIVEPPPGFGDEDTDIGAWLALTAAGLVLLGGLLRIASISITVSGKDTRARVAAVDARRQPADRVVPAAPAAPVDDEPTQAFSALDADDDQTAR